MRSLDEIIVDKICEAVSHILSRVIKPDIRLDKVTQLDEKMITKIKEKYGIEGVILDVDDTLRAHMREIPKSNQEWMEKLKGQLKIIIVSNGIDKNIEQCLREKGIDYIGFAKKPLKTNFIKACKTMGLEPQQILVIGDSVLADIYGGKRNNMKTALVKEVEMDR